LDSYFVATTAYEDALEGRQSIFVGRKGTGKTANLVALSSTLDENPENLVVKITPVAYEIDTLVSLFSKLQLGDNIRIHRRESMEVSDLYGNCGSCGAED
jgi:hypothetical protein